MEDHPEVFRQFSPAPNVLLDLLRARVDDAMLQEIAEADYGFDVEENLATLRSIRDTGEVPRPLQWHPCEVLALTRWAEPKPDDMRGHTVRAFACAVLLRAAADEESQGYLQGENHELAQLLDGALRLGPDVQRAAASSIAWGFGRAPFGEGERPFFALAVLLLAVFLGRDVCSEEQVGNLADWVIAEITAEQNCVEAFWRRTPGVWLYGMTCFDLRHDVWRALAGRMEQEAARYSRSDVRDCLTALAGRLR